MDTFAQAASYLIQSLGSLYLGVVVLRFLLQYMRADFQNPISQFLIRATHLPTRPIRKVLPSYRSFDGASLILAVLVQWLTIQLTATVVSGAGMINIAYVLSWAVLGILSLILNIYLYGLLAVIILSWVAPQAQHPAIHLLHQLIEPVMSPFRRLIPPLGGLDLSPIFMFLVINLLRIFILSGAQAVRLPAGIVPGI